MNKTKEINNLKKVDELELVLPTKEHKTQITEYIQEYISNGEKDEYPAIQYLTIRKADKKIVGNIEINKINKKPLLHSGHIGDSVRPSERRKGYATEQIRLALQKCKEQGIENVFMDTYKTNIGSVKSIIKNGGILEDEITINNEIVQIYKIDLKNKKR